MKMEKIKKFLQVMSAVCVIILLLTSSAFASPEINVVSEDEAVEMALFYYCLNALDQETVRFDRHVVTSLYDEEGNVTYYCVDFFYQGEGKGYVLIGANLTYFQCPEMYTDGSSSYYKTMLEGCENIYYNPIEAYVIEDDLSVRDLSNQETNVADIEGDVLKGNLAENRAVSEVAEENFSCGASQPIGGVVNDYVYSVHPVDRLSSLGYTQCSSTVYSSIESSMTNAGCFQPMVAAPTTITMSNGTKYSLGNDQHCVITAISNILLYWKPQCCSKYPNGYNDIFVNVCELAKTLGYFSPQLSGGTPEDRFFNGNPLTLMLRFNERYGYNNGYTEYTNSTNWNFIVNKIQNSRPTMMSFYHNNYQTAVSKFMYDHHAVVAFGYNYVNCVQYGISYNFRFLKIYDGWASSGKRYINWDMLENWETPHTNINGQQENIDVNMWTFCPYTP